MNAITSLMPESVWACAALAAILFVLAARSSRGPFRFVGGLLLLAGATALLLQLAWPQLLPQGSAVIHPDGTTDDPRVLGTLLLGAATLFSLLPEWRRAAHTPAAALGQAIPGILAGGVFGAVASFVHLTQPMALAGIALGAFAGTSALVLAIGSIRRGQAPVALLQALGTAAIVVAAMLSLHGARATGVIVPEGSAIDTLGMRVALTRVEAPRADLRVLDMALVSGSDSTRLRGELRGKAGSLVQSIAGGSRWSGPVIVPIGLEERRQRPHDIQWISRSAPLVTGSTTIRLAGFRFVQGDTIRLYADLDVTTPEGTAHISPGMFVSSKGEVPFAAEAPGIGPVAVARIDADQGRVGIVLSQMSEAVSSRVASLDVRLRPALPVAWVGLALALLGFLFSLTVRSEPRPQN